MWVTWAILKTIRVKDIADKCGFWPPRQSYSRISACYSNVWDSNRPFTRQAVFQFVLFFIIIFFARGWRPTLHNAYESRISEQPIKQYHHYSAVLLSHHYRHCSAPKYSWHTPPLMSHTSTVTLSASQWFIMGCRLTPIYSTKWLMDLFSCGLYSTWAHVLDTVSHLHNFRPDGRI